MRLIDLLNRLDTEGTLLVLVRAGVVSATTAEQRALYLLYTAHLCTLDTTRQQSLRLAAKEGRVSLRTVKRAVDMMLTPCK